MTFGYELKQLDEKYLSDTVVTKSNILKNITYDDLSSLVQRDELVPGQQYRIIDYNLYVDDGNLESGNHPFDLIVTADSKNTLNENARAIQHEGDTYFANSKLEA
jgi:hypothetical protein